MLRARHSRMDYPSGGDTKSATDFHEERPVIVTQPTSSATQTNESIRTIGDSQFGYRFDKLEYAFIKDPDPENGKKKTESLPNS